MQCYDSRRADSGYTETDWPVVRLSNLATIILGISSKEGEKVRGRDFNYKEH